MPAASSRQKLPLKSIVKWTLFLLVLVYVVRYGYQQWNATDLSEVQWAPGWWLVAGLLYFCSWLPAGCLWWLLLKQAGVSLAFYPTFRAHFCGHLGKYVPGKALSIIIRAAMLREFNVSATLAGMLATVETLITMAAGLLVSISLLPVVIGSESSDALTQMMPALKLLTDLDPGTQYLISGSILLLAILATPIVSRGLQWLTTRLASKMDTPDKTLQENSTLINSPIRFTSKMILLGSAIVAIGWFINGLSLGCLLMGCGVAPDSLTAPLLWTSAVAGATSLGFLVLFAPAGLGVREGILIAILQLSPQIDPSLAVIVALLFRIISFSSEVIFSGLLYSFSLKRSGKEQALVP